MLELITLSKITTKYFQFAYKLMYFYRFVFAGQLKLNEKTDFGQNQDKVCTTKYMSYF